jgi:mono/diheme cytochrome c family protein
MFGHNQLSILLATLLGGLALCGCRGAIKKEPPIHPVLDMDFQDKVKAQMASDFPGFKDGRGMRTPPANTVAVGDLDRAQLEAFKDANGEYLANPVPVTEALVRRGQERFNIYCSVCHDRSGSGQGLVLQRAQVASPVAFNYKVPHLATEQRLVTSRDGYLFQVITLGQGTMPAYGHQIPAKDRWAIVHYLRVLQNRQQ